MPMARTNNVRPAAPIAVYDLAKGIADSSVGPLGTGTSTTSDNPVQQWLLIAGAVLGAVGLVAFGGLLLFRNTSARKRSSKLNPPSSLHHTPLIVDKDPEPIDTVWETFVNSDGDEDERARAYQDSFPPSVLNAPSAETIANISNRKYDAFRFRALEGDSKVSISRDGFNVMISKRTGDTVALLSELPLVSLDTMFVGAPLATTVTSLPGSGSFAPPPRTWAYFEVLVKAVAESPARTIISIGVASTPYPPFRHVGKDLYSVGLYSDEGRICENGVESHPSFAKPVRAGTVIGCGYDASTGLVFFTSDGEYLGNGNTEPMRRAFHAAVAADGECSFSVNYGQEEFLYEPANVLRKFAIYQSEMMEQQDHNTLRNSADYADV
ncbi:hypothetical protein BJ742DRAFT_559637 [Cladochytrium replicatum]|nr:hypothetical protein BJ742DRAFT_559637 [Cladochytrium replicatum]